MNNFLLEAKPGVGKTTLLCRIAEGLSHHRIGGFYTGEIREGESRKGFRIQTFSGISGILSHVSFHKGPSVGKYRVDVPQFEKIGIAALKAALEGSDVIFIDEIGKMELFSHRFQEIVLACLDATKPVIATVMSRPLPFVDRIKCRLDVVKVQVTLENRDALVDRLIEKIERSIHKTEG